jgi:hypothetical protein
LCDLMNQSKFPRTTMSSDSDFAPGPSAAW